MNVFRMDDDKVAFVADLMVETVATVVQAGLASPTEAVAATATVLYRLIKAFEVVGMLDGMRDAMVDAIVDEEDLSELFEQAERIANGDQQG